MLIAYLRVIFERNVFTVFSKGSTELLALFVFLILQFSGKVVVIIIAKFIKLIITVSVRSIII